MEPRAHAHRGCPEGLIARRFPFDSGNASPLEYPVVDLLPALMRDRSRSAPGFRWHPIIALNGGCWPLSL